MTTTEYVNIILGFIGGLGLFLFGMHVMASGLQKSAGGKMKKLLEALTRNKLLGILVGAGVTGIIQSSSAVTVMVIGFVNAGILSLSQSVGVIMGANIGTTITAWIVSLLDIANMGGIAAWLNPTKLAPLAVGIGAFMVLLASGKVKQIGEIIIGFGVLFMGMSLMSSSVAPLRELQFFREVFVSFGDNPLLGIFVGAAVTAVIQSSSASVGILQSLALSGLVPWNAAVYIIMGQNIGTCVTGLLSSIGTTKNAKAAAYIHLLFNLIGSVVFGTLAIIYFSLINSDFGYNIITITQISIVHTAFNISNTALLYPFSDWIIKMAEKLASKGKVVQDESELVHLDDRILSTPGFAIENCVKEIIRLGQMAQKNLSRSCNLIMKRDLSKLDKILNREKNIDALSAAITNYLVKLCNENISEEENTFITSLFHSVNDMERIGDHCENIAELGQYAFEEEVFFTDTGLDQLREIMDLTKDCFNNALLYLESGDIIYRDKVYEQESKVDSLENAFREGHIQRLSNNECSAASGVVYLDALTNLERISDHAKNLVEININGSNK